MCLSRGAGGSRFPVMVLTMVVVELHLLGSAEVGCIDYSSRLP